MYSKGIKNLIYTLLFKKLNSDKLLKTYFATQNKNKLNINSNQFLKEQIIYFDSEVNS